MKNFSIEIPVWKILLVVKEQNKKAMRTFDIAWEVVNTWRQLLCFVRCQLRPFNLLEQLAPIPMVELGGNQHEQCHHHKRNQ